MILAAVILDHLALELKLENNFPYGVVKIDSTLIPYPYSRMQRRSAVHSQNTPNSHPSTTHLYHSLVLSAT